MRFDILLIGVCLLIPRAVFSMNAEGISFERFPAEVAESILECSLRAEPEIAYRLAYVCQRWDEVINSPFLTKKIMDSDPDRYCCWNSTGSKLRTVGARFYHDSLKELTSVCQKSDATQDDFESLFKNPYTSCAQNQTLPLQNACRNAHTVAVEALRRHGAIAKKGIVHDSLWTIHKIIQSKVNLDINCMLHCFKQICENNPRIAYEKDIFFRSYHLARQNVSVLLQVFETLIGVGASINGYESDEMPVLLGVYVGYCHEEINTRTIAIWLMEHGADPYMKLNSNDTIYALAKMNPDQRFLKLIEAHWNKNVNKS